MKTPVSYGKATESPPWKNDLNPPAEGEVSLRVLACGLCGTDSHIVKGEFVGAKSGVVLGNEACGEVVDVGPGVSILAGRSTCGCGS